MGVQIFLLVLEVTLFGVFAVILTEQIATWGWSLLLILSILYKVYCLYVVKTFMLELVKKSMRKSSHSGPPLIPVATSSASGEPLERIEENE
jgi:membrane protein implicated in regulation of membrane protease activity